MHQSKVRVGALLLAAAGSVGTAFAQTPSATPVVCRNIAASMERLACYDAADAHKEAASAAPVAAAAPSATASADNTGPAPRATTSMFDTAWGFDPASARYTLSLDRANYLLFGRYTDNPNSAPYLPLSTAAGNSKVNLDSAETEFQLSIKGRVWATDDRRWGVWAAYTQQSQWQLFNSDVSRPFRETNYMPELLVSYGPDVDLGGGFRWKLLNAGFNHQSNGRTDVISRSWNRLFAEFGVERDDLALSATLWYRLPEDESDDDNPDITDYYGHGKIAALYRWQGNSFTAEVRGNVSTGKGAVQLGWFSAPFLGPFRGYVQVFSGYGETLIDYNWSQNTIGFGVAVNDGL